MKSKLRNVFINYSDALRCKCAVCFSCRLTFPGFILPVIFLFSCTGEQLDDCFTKTGPDVTLERSVEAFHSIELYNNVNLVLIPGLQQELRIEGGKNLLDAIKTEVSDSTLTIKSTLKCNWVRNYDREITVYATVAALRHIRYESSGDINCSGPLQADSLKVSVWGGGGSINMDVNVQKLTLEMHYGTADFSCKGRSLITTIFSNSYGPFYCRDLVSNILYIRHNGTQHCYVHALHILEVEISSVGNIYYYGDPYQMKSNITGSGKLLRGE